MSATATAISEAHPASAETLLLWYREGSLDAREEVARRYMPMARRLASRYRNSSESVDDLEQVAYMGLLKTIDRYEPSAGSFTAYVIMTVRGELKRHFRDHGWTISMTRPLQERSLMVSAATERLTARTGRAPGMRELAAETGLSLDDLGEAMEAAHGYSPLSLDAPVGSDPDAAAGSLGDSFGVEEPGYASVETREALSPVVAALSERERRILHLRFVEDRTQSDIAEQCGLSQMHVSRLLRATLSRMVEAADPVALDRARAKT